jgi:flagellar motor protein MotB
VKRQLTKSETQPSVAGLGSSITALSPSVAASAAEADGWMITLSDLTLLLVGFAVVWWVTAAAEPPVVQPAAPAVKIAAPEIETRPPAPETWRQLAKEITDVVAATGLAPDAIVEAQPGEILLSLRDSVPFDSGKAALRPQAKTILEKIAVAAIAHPVLSVSISGHTDDRRIASSRYPSNWELSTARAISVARHLVQRGLHPSRIAVQGFADHRPLKPNSTSANRQSNRRVEIRLTYNATPKSDGAVSANP